MYDFEVLFYSKGFVVQKKYVLVSLLILLFYEIEKELHYSIANIVSNWMQSIQRQSYIKMITPTKKDIQAARNRISSYIHKTPILTSKYINELCHAEVFFKCENLQKTGSFKVRGASNKILQLTNPNGLCTHSSGNHAQAVAYIASQLGIKASIVMPIDTPDIKKNAVKGYGAQIILSGPTVPQQQRQSSRIAKETGAAFIHPYNDLQIITGASTCAMEIYEELQNLDYLVVPIGGGGLCSGTLVATLAFSSSTKVIGVEPFLARDAKESIQKNCIQPQYPPLTLAEGVRTNIGDVTFQFLKKYLSDIILVGEDEMIEASKLFQQRMKIIVQLSGAIVLAAIKKDPRFKGKRVAAIISGGNMNLSPFFNQLKANL